MIKRILPLLIGLSIGGVALAQEMPASATSSTTTATQTTTVTKVNAMEPHTTTHTTTITKWKTRKPHGALSEHAIKGAIANAGYKEVKGLKFEDGVWRSKARGGNKKWVKLAVGPVSGKVYPADAPSKLDKDEISAKLAAAGYQNVKEVEFDAGLWSADAKTTKGNDVDLLVDPNDGTVVAKSHD